MNRIDADYTITDNRWEAQDEGVWPGAASGYTYSMACEAFKRGELAPAHGEHLTTTEGEDPTDEEAVFDPKSPMPTTSTCPN